MEEADEACL